MVHVIFSSFFPFWYLSQSLLIPLNIFTKNSENVILNSYISTIFINFRRLQLIIPNGTDHSFCKWASCFGEVKPFGKTFRNFKEPLRYWTLSNSFKKPGYLSFLQLLMNDWKKRNGEDLLKTQSHLKFSELCFFKKGVVSSKEILVK